MTSQRWLSGLDVAQPEWIHGLVVILPENLEGPSSEAAGWATLYASLGWFGSPGGPPAEALAAGAGRADVEAAAHIATGTGAPAAVLFAVPPALVVTADNRSRLEDDLMSYGDLRFMEEHAAERWLVELPMTKAVVRAMDTVAAFTATAAPRAAQRFAVMGTSKRGGVSWHAAAVDKRVAAIVPIAKALNQKGFIHRTYRCLNGTPVVAATYTKRELLAAETAGFIEQLYAITDPFLYPMEYERVSKLVITAGQDEFFMPDHTALWWSHIPGAKMHLMVPEEGHIIGGEQVLNLAPAISAFVRGVSTRQAAPALTWSMDRGGGRITAQLLHGPAPLRVELWQAVTCNALRRDFRLHNFDKGENCTRCGVELPQSADPKGLAQPTCENRAVRWQSSPLAAASFGGNKWVAQVEPPEDGRWAAFFISFEFKGPDPPLNSAGPSPPREQYRLSTEVAVVPDNFPFPEVPGEIPQAFGEHLVLSETA